MVVEPNYDDTYYSDSIDSINISPVCKTNWKTLGARNYWDEKLEFNEVYSKLILKILCDEGHPRDAFILRTSGDVIKHFAELMENGEYDKLPIKEAVIKEITPDLENIFTDYNNAVTLGPQNQSETLSIISTTPEIADLVENILFDEKEPTKDMYMKLCEVFGISACCAEFHYSQFKRGDSDPLYEIGCNTDSAEKFQNSSEDIIIKNPDPFLNQFWRYKGLRFTYSLPCSFSCDAAGHTARTNYSMLMEIINQSKQEKNIENLLSWFYLPMTWTGYHGLVNQRNAYRIGSYRTDDYWSRKRIIWRRPHEDKPDFEEIHHTAKEEELDQSYGAL